MRSFYDASDEDRRAIRLLRELRDQAQAEGDTRELKRLNYILSLTGDDTESEEATDEQS